MTTGAAWFPLLPNSHSCRRFSKSQLAAAERSFGPYPFPRFYNNFVKSHYIHNWSRIFSLYCSFVIPLMKHRFILRLLPWSRDNVLLQKQIPFQLDYHIGYLIQCHKSIRITCRTIKRWVWGCCTATMKINFMNGLLIKRITIKNHDDSMWLP